MCVCVGGGLWYTGTGQLDNDYTHHWRNVSHLSQKPFLSRNGWGRRAGPSTIDCWQARFSADIADILRHKGREEWGEVPSFRCACRVSLPPCSVHHFCKLAVHVSSSQGIYLQAFMNYSFRSFSDATVELRVLRLLVVSYGDQWTPSAHPCQHV